MRRVGDGIIIDDDDWPMVVVTYTNFSEEDHLQHFDELREIFQEQRQGPFVVLADLRNAQPLNAAQRRSTAQFWEDIAPLISDRFVALVYLSDSVIIRGIIQAIAWIKKPPAPTRTMEDPELALQWLEERLKQRLAQAG